MNANQQIDERFIRPMGLRYKKANVTVRFLLKDYADISMLIQLVAQRTWCDRATSNNFS
jgi:hypothetical protein